MPSIGAAHLLLVGPDEEELKTELQDAEEKIHFTGYTANPERYFAAADIACLPSRREGFGVALIEAFRHALATTPFDVLVNES